MSEFTNPGTSGQDGFPNQGSTSNQESPYDQGAPQYQASQQQNPQYGQYGNPPYQGFPQYQNAPNYQSGPTGPMPGYQQPYGSYPGQTPTGVPYGYVPREKIVAGLLAIFLGGLGVHNFYLGYTGKAIAQLLLTIVGWIIVVGPIVAVVWSLIEGILILSSNWGSPWHRDAKGVELRD